MARAGLEVGQVDEEQLVEAAAAQELGGRRVTSLAVATTKIGLFPLLKPGGEGAQQARRTRVLPCPGALPAKPFSISSTQSATGAMASAEASARARPSSAPSADPEDAREIEAEERDAEETRHRLGGERLAAALHAEEQDAARHQQPEALWRRGRRRGPAR